MLSSFKSAEMKKLRSFSPNMSAASASTTDPPRCAVPRRRRANNPEIEHSSRSESQSRSHTDYDDDDDEEEHQRSTETDDYPYTESSSVCANTTPPHSNYINVAPLPVFRGEPGECPVAHVTRFLRVCRANNAPSPEAMANIFPVTLDGEAGLWYELNVEPNPSLLQWERMKGEFTRAYQRPEFVDQSRSELMTMRQKDGESVNSYFLRLQWVLKRWPDHGLPDSMLKGLFVDGLKEDYQDWVVLQKPNSLQDAFRLALAWEEAKSIRLTRGIRDQPGDRAVAEVKCGFCDGPHEEGSCEVRRRMRDLWVMSRDQMALVRPVRQEGSISSRRGFGGQCQCWKHQCWKKNWRSVSLVNKDDSKDDLLK